MRARDIASLCIPCPDTVWFPCTSIRRKWVTKSSDYRLITHISFLLMSLYLNTAGKKKQPSIVRQTQSPGCNPYFQHIPSLVPCQNVSVPKEHTSRFVLQHVKNKIHKKVKIFCLIPYVTHSLFPLQLI